MLLPSVGARFKLQLPFSWVLGTWKNDDSASSQLLDRLLEAIDAGAISIMTRIFFTKMDWESQDKSVGAMNAREACCRMLCAMFGIARNDDTGIGQVRLYNALDAASLSQKAAPSKCCYCNIGYSPN